MTAIATPPDVSNRAASVPQARIQWEPLALITLQVWAVAFLAYWFRLEGHAFADRILPLAALGFLPHHLLPARFRMGFFLALSLVATGLLFGVAGGAWLVGVIAAFVAVTQLPLPFGVRIAMIGAMSALLAAMRLGNVPTPWPDAIWPILASILMFRLIAYLYDLKHGAAPKGMIATLAYFLLLPNLTFTLFPVVDPATFRRTYYDRPALSIYTDGVQWLLRGALQLVLYRLVYQYVSIAPSTVSSTPELVQYLLGNFGLYLRVSGTFHLAIGLLQLYGFRLPETHRLFYLSSTFTDFWRRINIYWKDFMQKLVFAPTFYPLSRRIGQTHALTVATLAVFAATWFFHGYQWFWILGRWELSVTDTLFWGILAVVLVVNSHREMRRGRNRQVSRTAQQSNGLKQAASLAVRTAATFSVIVLLWALWNSPTVDHFVRLVSVVELRAADVALLLATPLVIGTVAVLFDRYQPRYEKVLSKRPQTRTLIAFAPLVLLGVVGHPVVAGSIGSGAHRVALAMRSNGGLNRADAAELQRGYYEQLTDTRRFNGELWNVLSQRPAEWNTPEQAGYERILPTFVRREVVPGVRVQFHGTTVSTNSLGMRDREYTIAKPAGTWRIALLGQSYVLGNGVNDLETFESIMEREMNPVGAKPVELLNFGIGAFTPLQQAGMLAASDRVQRMRPDVVLMVGHLTDLTNGVAHLAALGDSIAVPFDTLRALMAKSGIAAGATVSQRARALAPFRREIATFAYARVAQSIREMGAEPVWVYVPTLLEPAQDVPELMAMARAAGFRILDVPEVYIGYDEHKLAVALWDRHPNAKGHQVIARRLLDALNGSPELLGRAEGQRPLATTRATMTPPLPSLSTP